MSRQQLVAIQCLDASHPSKHAKVGTLRRGAAGAWEPLADGDGNLVWLDEQNEESSRASSDREHAPYGLRAVFRFQCPLCGDDLQVRGEKLDAVLDELFKSYAGAGLVASDGVLALSLACLAAKVR